MNAKSDVDLLPRKFLFQSVAIDLLHKGDEINFKTWINLYVKDVWNWDLYMRVHFSIDDLLKEIRKLFVVLKEPDKLRLAISNDNDVLVIRDADNMCLFTVSIVNNNL